MNLLSKGVQQYKEKEGKENMSGVVERYAKEYAKECIADEKLNSIQNMLRNTDFTLEQALDILEIQGKERTYIIEHMQDKQ